MTDQARWYLVAYDIGHDRRRTKVSEALSSFGDRVQYSVFLLRLHPARATQLWGNLRHLIDRNADSVLVCDIGPDRRSYDRIMFIGVERPRYGGEPLVI